MPGSVLLVDRDADTRVILQTVLEHHRYEVRATTSAPEALRLAHEAPPDVVILEFPLLLPDGATLTEAFRRDPELAGTAILSITASALSAEWIARETALCNAYLVKPINLAQVVGLVQRNIAAGSFR